MEWNWPLLILCAVLFYIVATVWRNLQAAKRQAIERERVVMTLEAKLRNAREELLAVNATRQREHVEHVRQMEAIGVLAKKLSDQRIRDCKTMRHLEADRERLLRQIREVHPQ